MTKVTKKQLSDFMRFFNNFEKYSSISGETSTHSMSTCAWTFLREYQFKMPEWISDYGKNLFNLARKVDMSPEDTQKVIEELALDFDKALEKIENK